MGVLEIMEFMQRPPQLHTPFTRQLPFSDSHAGRSRLHCLTSHIYPRNLPKNQLLRILVLPLHPLGCPRIIQQEPLALNRQLCRLYEPHQQKILPDKALHPRCPPHPATLSQNLRLPTQAQSFFVTVPALLPPHLPRVRGLACVGDPQP